MHCVFQGLLVQCPNDWQLERYVDKQHCCLCNAYADWRGTFLVTRCQGSMCTLTRHEDEGQPQSVLYHTAAHRMRWCIWDITGYQCSRKCYCLHSVQFCHQYHLKTMLPKWASAAAEVCCVACLQVCQPDRGSESYRVWHCESNAMNPHQATPLSPYTTAADSLPLAAPSCRLLMLL